MQSFAEKNRGKKKQRKVAKAQKEARSALILSLRLCACALKKVVRSF